MSGRMSTQLLFAVVIGNTASANPTDVPAAGTSAALPVPLTFWKFQEPAGAPRVSEGQHAYLLSDADPDHPVGRTAAGGGLFGRFALNLTGGSAEQHLRAERHTAPAITTSIAGPDATVSMVAWVKRPAGVYRRDNQWLNNSYGFLAGVWGDTTALEARQYAIYFDLGACRAEAGHGTVKGTPVYHQGLAAHVSNCGGATPGYQYSMTAACDPRPLQAEDWHCVANVFDGRAINAYVNGTLVTNPAGGSLGKVPLPPTVNPYPYAGGIYSPEAHNRTGAEFGVGMGDCGNCGYNQYTGLLGGLAVFAEPLPQAQVAEVCAWAPGWSRV